MTIIDLFAFLKLFYMKRGGEHEAKGKGGEASQTFALFSLQGIVSEDAPLSSAR